MTSLRAPHNRILVEQEEPDRMTETGLYLPDQALVQTQRGTVVSVGPEVRDVEPGDVIAWEAAFAGAAVYHDGKTYISLIDRDCWGVIE